MAPALTHEQKMAIDAQVREELGPRPAAPSCFTFQSYAPYSDAALMDKTAGYFAKMDECRNWDRAFAARFAEIEAASRASNSFDREAA